jgi:hypothetical protein
MNIQWKKVTWYSKTLALILFVALPFIGFVIGIQYGQSISSLSGSGVQVLIPGSSQSQSGSNYYNDVSSWQTDKRPDAGYSIAAPLDFNLGDDYSITPNPNWRMGSNGEAGNLLASLTVPSSFEPQTNFAEARLTIGRSGSQVAVADCLKPDATSGPGVGVATTTINGTTFSIFTSADAGAGNFYETTSYRTVHAGECFAVEYTIHSSQIANYPAEYHLQAFDKNKVTSVLDRIVGTFNFL